MKSERDQPIYLYLAECVMGSVFLMSLGLYTNTLSVEYAVKISEEWLAPIMFLGLGGVLVHGISWGISKLSKNRRRKI